MVKLRKLLISSILIFIFIIINLQSAAANITVAPRRFIFRIDERNTQVVEVTNKSNHRMRVRVYPAKPDGMDAQLYLGDWVVLYPPILELAPGQKRAVRFSVRAPEDLADGEYRSLLFFEEQPSQETSSEEGVNFNLLTRLGINIYGQYGELNYSGKLANPKLTTTEDTVKVNGKFVNQGNAHLRMEVEAQLIKLVKQEEKTKEKIIEKKKLTDFVVHRAASKQFQRQIKLPVNQGTKLKLIFRQDGEQVCQFSRDI